MNFEKVEEKKALSHAKSALVSEPLHAPKQFKSTNSGIGVFSMGMVQNDQVKTLNAKKLDIDFDSDDFFNSFEPIKVEQKQEVKKNTSKLVEVKEEESKFMFQMKNNTASNNNSNNNHSLGAADDREAKERLMALGNKKCISSNDIFGAQEQKSQEVLDRY
mmetsp:Transcript_12844/g.12754  ORF Transcript_12844/g.12754 Transcript_12844/m.12754 type:complete len:161 (+) Transcript_12844:481-963(+)